MAKVLLTNEQDRWRKELRKYVDELKANLRNPEFDYQKVEENMGDLAHKLHMSIEPHPKHHRYMLDNRGLNADHPDFYKHIHPVEDLLAYLKNDTANDDPEDQTINEIFSMRIFSRRWGHEDQYDIKRIETGWEISFLARGGNCDQEGKPFLFERLDHDSINYPAALPGYMKWLWEQAAEQGLAKEEVQKELDAIGFWISACEKYTPRGIFRGYK